MGVSTAYQKKKKKIYELTKHTMRGKTDRGNDRESKNNKKI
jgi:hypothetical protein